MQDCGEVLNFSFLAAFLNKHCKLH